MAGHCFDMSSTALAEIALKVSAGVFCLEGLEDPHGVNSCTCRGCSRSDLERMGLLTSQILPSLTFLLFMSLLFSLTQDLKESICWVIARCSLNNEMFYFESQKQTLTQLLLPGEVTALRQLLQECEGRCNDELIRGWKWRLVIFIILLAQTVHRFLAFGVVAFGFWSEFTMRVHLGGRLSQGLVSLPRQ